jgi:hypothetical protein
MAKLRKANSYLIHFYMCRSKTSGPLCGVRQGKQDLGTWWPQSFHFKATEHMWGLLGYYALDLALNFHC